MTITQLVTQAQAGSRAAFGELYESLAGDLYRMALYTLGSQQDAEDAVADTFAEAWKGKKTCGSRRRSAAGCSVSSRPGASGRSPKS